MESYLAVSIKTSDIQLIDPAILLLFFSLLLCWVPYIGVFAKVLTM
jgi:hypothetical protein